MWKLSIASSKSMLKHLLKDLDVETVDSVIKKYAQTLT